jgi:hypothetical protein
VDLLYVHVKRESYDKLSAHWTFHILLQLMGNLPGNVNREPVLFYPCLVDIVTARGALLMGRAPMVFKSFSCDILATNVALRVCTP